MQSGIPSLCRSNANFHSLDKSYNFYIAIIKVGPRGLATVPKLTAKLQSPKDNHQT